MEVAKAAETNGATTSSSFLQHLRVVSGIFYLPNLRDAATSLAGGRAFGIQEDGDLEARSPEAEEETNVQTMFKFLHDNFNRAVRNSIVEKALAIMPTFPACFCFTLPGLYALAQIKWQLPPSGFPSPTLYKWYIVCVTSLLTEFVASIAQWIISSAAAGP